MELKAGVITTPHNEGMCFNRGSDAIAVTERETEFYLKSEADKVIAELEKNHKKEVGQLLFTIAKLKKERDWLAKRSSRRRSDTKCKRIYNHCH